MEISITIRAPRWQRPGRWATRLAMVAGLLLVAGPVLATDRFSDVPTDSVHHANINAIADAGITLGCNLEGTLYCPDTVVTRDQMGSFLARAAGLGANPPVANADKLDGLDASGFLPAGDYTVMQQGPWLASGGTAVTITYRTDANAVASAATGERFVQLALDGPAAVVGGIGYGFASARVCAYGSLAVTIDATHVIQATSQLQPNPQETTLASDGTDRVTGSGTCYTVSDAEPTIPTGGTTLLLDLQYGSASTAQLLSVTTTWTPVSPP